MSSFERAWLGNVPRMRHERHYGDRIVRCTGLRRAEHDNV